MLAGQITFYLWIVSSVHMVDWDYDIWKTSNNSMIFCMEEYSSSFYMKKNLMSFTELYVQKNAHDAPITK